MNSKTVVVFCAGRDGKDPEFRQTAIELGQELSKQGAIVVSGGGRRGLMGALVDGVLSVGGHPKTVFATQLAGTEERYTTAFRSEDVIECSDLAARKQTFCDLADAFVVLPGGLGTLEELMDVLSWSQLHLHNKPIFLLNVNGFYTALDGFLRNGVDVGLVSEVTLTKYTLVDSVSSCIDHLRRGFEV